MATIDSGALKVVAGEEHIGLFPKNEKTLYCFCKVCGSNLFSRLITENLVNVRLGTLHDTPSIKPMAHVYVGSKAAWHQITDTLPQFPSHPS